MSAAQPTTFAIYRKAIEQVMQGEERLPSLPNMTFQIRRAASDPNTTISKLCSLIGTDPSLSVVIMRHSSSPVFRTLEQARDLESAVRLMGIAHVANIIMAHSLKSLFINNNPQLKALFAISWKRQALKASMSRFLASTIPGQSADEAFISSLLSEVGTLAILSSLSGVKEVPDQRTYLTLCRHYSKSLATIILRRWDLDPKYIEITKECGNWSAADSSSPAGAMSTLDVVNLSLYHSVCLLKPDHNLPALTGLACFQRLPERQQQLDERGLLNVISQNLKQIVAAAQAFH